MANTKFDSKSFNPEAFGLYVKRVPSTKKNELAKSRAIGTNEQARAALSSQTGSLYARIPYFGRISGKTSQNNNGATDIDSTNLTTFEQGFIVASRMDAWTERSFSKNITAGVDFMDEVGRQISDYKLEVKQDILLAMLKGVFAMSTTTGDAARKNAAKEFLAKHVYDVSATENGVVNATTLNTAIQKACGDNKNVFKLVIMHSAVATNLENLKLLKYLTYTNENGVEQDLTMASWNGRTVLIDDNMPTEDVAATYTASTDTEVQAGKTYYTKSGSEYSVVAEPTGNPSTSSYYELTAEAYTKYTTYVLGEGSIILDDVGDSVPYEMNRDPKTNGGQDTLYVRDRYICGVDGISFEKPASVTASAANSDLEAGANWAIISDGTNAIDQKAIALCKIVSKG